jgi:two-component system, LytTR family, sensor kinase
MAFERTMRSVTLDRPPDIVLVSEVLGNGAALLLTVVLLLLIVRTARTNFAMWLGAFCALLWIGGGLSSTLLILTGSTLQSRAVWITHLAGLASGGILPISFLLLWPLPEPAGGWRVRLRRWLLILAVATAVITMVAAIGMGRFRILRGIMSVAPFDAAILMTAGALIVLQGRLKTLADRVYVILTLLGMWISGAAVLTLNHFALSPQWCAVLNVVKEQAPFLTLMGTNFFFARFRAADVLIKSSLKITAGTALAVAAAVIIPETSSQPMCVLLTTALLGLLLLLYLAASNAVEYTVDRWVLPRPDYRAALRNLWNELNSLDAEPVIFASAQKHIQALLELRHVRVAAVPRSATLAEELRVRQAQDDCEIEAAVRVRGERAYVLSALPGCGRRSLLSADIRFLEDAATLIGGRIEALLAERERTERQAREAKLLQLAAESELKALRAQINPHFLFNSLNTIADLIVTDPVKAESMTVLLAKVFRHVLLYSDRQMTAVSEEIEFLKTYLRIEEVRFGPRLSVRMDVDPSVSSVRVPSLILQPVVENAIKHGLAPKIGPGHLHIRAGRDGRFVKLEVEDDGVGFSKPGLAESAPRGVGLKIIAERLKTLYQAGASLQFESGDTPGSRVTILIPLEAEAP